MATYTFTGPSTGVSQTASTNFTVTLDGATLAGTLVITPHDGGAGGTFTPASVSLTDSVRSGTFTYTPVSTGGKTLSVTNSAAYVDPANLTYTVTLNKDLTINQILWAQEKNHGYVFPFYELTRDGGISEGDAVALRSSYETYKQARSSYPSSTPNLPDLAAQVHTTTSKGRTGRGQTPAGADKPLAATVTQTGR